MYVSTCNQHTYVHTANAMCGNSSTFHSKSGRMTVSQEAKKKQAVRDEQVSYLHIALL